MNGTVLFDSETPDASPSETASTTKIDDAWILDGVRRLEMSDRRLSTSPAGSELEVVVPYVEEWGRHRLSILYRFSYRRLSARLAYATLILGSVSGLSIMLSFAVGYVAARRVSRPLAVMTRRVEAIGKGDRDSRLEIDPGAFDELRVFAEAFNTMAGELDRHLETLRQSNLDLSASNAALELKNAELEQYAYTAP